MAEIEFTEEQALLAQSAGDFLQANSDFSAVRESMQRRTGFDPRLWKQLGELGFVGLALPETYGGAGLGCGSLVCVLEPAGRHLLSSPLLPTSLASQLLLLADEGRQRDTWLPRLASGQAIATVALSEGDGSYDLLTPEVQARAEDGGYSLHGSKLRVLDADCADLLLVSAWLQEGPAIFAIERAQIPQGALQRETILDERRRAYRLELEGLSVPKSARLVGDATSALSRLSLIGALLTAAEMCGGTAGVMDLTLEYLRTRKQFGKLIGGYQALKHPMAEILVMHEQGRSLLYHAATALDAGSPETETAVRMAKAQIGETYTHAAYRAIQFHGAIGFTYECHAQLFLRHALFNEYCFGDAPHHRRKLSDLLFG